MADNKDISILIVDDNDMTRETLRVILRHDTYNVAGEATDGSIALEMATRLKPDIILLDVVMPKVSGLEALRSIRLVLPDVMILMVTANKDQETVSEAVQAGISGYIIKPFNAKKVLDTVQSVANKVRSARQTATAAAPAAAPTTENGAN
jgi:two-component system, chemotaxis family, chemotaxis protein CheY